MFNQETLKDSHEQGTDVIGWGVAVSLSEPATHHEKQAGQEWFNHSPNYKQLLALFDAEGVLHLNNQETPVAQALREACKVNKQVIVIGCIDEGVPAMISDHDQEEKVYQLGLGGSGILLPPDGRDKLLSFLAGLVKEGKTVKITSHESCGAAGIACRTEGLSTEPDQVVERAKSFSQQLATDLANLTDTDIDHQFISAPEMTRPEVHNAFGIFVDTTGVFNPARDDNEFRHTKLPPMFNASAIIGNNPHMVDTVQVAINIAFGDHGYGQRFTEQMPFSVVVVLKKKEETPEQADLLELLEKLINESDKPLALKKLYI